MNFTDINILSIYTEEITVEKKEGITTKPKNTITCHLSVGKIVGKVFTSSWHCLSCQLQKKLPTKEKFVSMFQKALELFIFQLHY